MRHCRPSTCVLALLDRLGWQRDAARWTIPCRDREGGRARLRVGLAAEGVRIGSLTLTPLQVGRLRGALADAVTTYARLRPDDHQTPRSGASRHAA
jgi:hypothetical protein